MTHIGVGKKVIVTPNSVGIVEISSGKIIAQGLANHDSNIYEFSHLMPYSNNSVVLTHAN